MTDHDPRYSEPTTTANPADWTQSAEGQISTSGDTGQARAAPEAKPQQTRKLLVIPALVVANVVVFLIWQLARDNQQLVPLMVSNFMVSPILLAQGRLWTLLTAAFSHIELWHLVINMFVLFSFGRVLEMVLGRRPFLLFYLVAAVFSSACHCAVSLLVMGQSDIYALGASGAVSAVLIAVSLLLPRAKVLLFLVVPVPALVAGLLFVAIDIWGLVVQSRGIGSSIGHGAHLGGALCGALFFVTYLRPLQKRMQAMIKAERLPLSPKEVAEVVRLRAKVARQGAAALTAKEREFMQQIRAKLDRAAAQARAENASGRDEGDRR